MKKILFVTIIFCATFCFAANFISKIESTHPNGLTKKEITFEVKDSIYYPVKTVKYDSTGFITEMKSYKDSLSHGNQIFYHNKALSFIVPYQKGKIHGSMKVYYSSGQLKFSQKYRKGVRHGKVKTYYEDGSKWKYFSYNNGIQNGRYTEYYPDGTIKITGSRKNGKPKGKFSKFFPNGQIEEKGEYKNFRKCGLWLKYDEDGNLLEYKYHNKNKPEQKSIWYYLDKSIKAEGYYIGNQRVGRWYTFYESGEVKEISDYDSTITDNPFGVCEEYWERTQKIKFTGLRRNELIDSLWVGYDSLGTKLAEYNYYKGNLNGLFTTFYSNGSIKEQGVFTSNKKDGTWKEHDEVGNLIDEVKHRANIQYKTGEYRSYYDSGALQAKRFFIGSQRAGKSYSYYEDGSIGSIDDRINNYRKDFFPNGNIKREEYYTGYNKGFFDTKMEKTYYENGNLKEEKKYNEPGHFRTLNYKKEFFENGKIKNYLHDDTQIKYYKNGNIYLIYEMKNGKKNGLYQKFEKKTGQICNKRFYKDDRIHGEDKHYYNNGILRSYNNYINGKQEGVREQYYQSGKLKSRTNYIKSNKEGEYTQYYESGIIEHKCNYKHNRKTGAAYTYDKNGEIIKTENFDNK